MTLWQRPEPGALGAKPLQSNRGIEAHALQTHDAVDTPCPICAYEPDEHWPLLARQARYQEPIETRVCPRCTLVRTGQAADTKNHVSFYRARVYAGPSPSMLVEDGRGRIGLPRQTDVNTRLRERLVDVRHAIAAADVDVSPSILHVGSADGTLLAVARSVFVGAELQGLEPWLPWSQSAEAKGITTASATLETWQTDQRFDVVIDVDMLPHLPDPVAHLKAVARVLKPGGIAVIGVPNLLGVTGDLARHVLRGESPNAFTPRALATACRRAGFLPLLIAAGTELRMVCRRAEVSEAVVSGPDAMSVAHSAWGNDLRLSIKRALAEHGPSPKVLRTAARVHRRCPSPAARADIAIEIAVQCERCSDYEAAAKWLARSLEDRDDPEVEATLGQLVDVVKRVRAAWVEPAEPVEEKASQPEPDLALAS